MIIDCNLTIQSVGCKKQHTLPQCSDRETCNILGMEECDTEQPDAQHSICCANSTMKVDLYKSLSKPTTK